MRRTLGVPWKRPEWTNGGRERGLTRRFCSRWAWKNGRGSRDSQELKTHSVRFLNSLSTVGWLFPFPTMAFSSFQRLSMSLCLSLSKFFFDTVGTLCPIALFRFLSIPVMAVSLLPISIMTSIATIPVPVCQSVKNTVSTVSGLDHWGNNCE